MQNFKDTLETLEDASHIKEIVLSNKDEIISSIEKKPGTLGSIKIYHHLWLIYGELNTEAALEGIDLYCEYSEEAQEHPGKHPNIDRLFDVIECEEILKIKIIK